MSLKAKRCFGLCPFSQYIQILKTFQVYIQFMSHALYLKHSCVYSWKWEEFAKIIFAIEFFLFFRQFQTMWPVLTPDFLSPSPTQLDYKYFSSYDHNSTKICSCVWCTGCTSPVLLPAGLCQYSPWKGLGTAEVYPCCPSNTSTQAAPQELSPALIPRRAAVADCWFMQLLQAERLHEGSFPRESIGAGSWDPLRNLHSPLLPEILTVTTIHDISLYLWAGIPGYFQCCPEPLWWSASSFRFLNKCLCCHGAEHRANVSEVLRSW